MALHPKAAVLVTVPCRPARGPPVTLPPLARRAAGDHWPRRRRRRRRQRGSESDHCPGQLALVTVLHAHHMILRLRTVGALCYEDNAAGGVRLQRISESSASRGDSLRVGSLEATFIGLQVDFSLLCSRTNGYIYYFVNGIVANDLIFLKTHSLAHCDSELLLRAIS